MADRSHYLDNLRQRTPEQSASTTIAYGIAGLCLLYQVLLFLDYPILAPTELFWNALVYLIPQSLLLDRAKRQELGTNDMLSQTHAAKSEALRMTFGFRSGSVLHSLPSGGEVLRRFSSVTKPVTSNAPPGLGNWDNSCYQNSVLQGLTSLQSLRTYLAVLAESEGLPPTSTTAALSETAGNLSSGENGGKHIWTPAKLKNMSSWQQQDAQEYYSKIVEELEKESARALNEANPTAGLAAAAETDFQSDAEPQDGHKSLVAAGSPLEGLLAQRVACTHCAFSEGLSMIPFNCLTLPLGSNYEYSLDQCLDEYTKLETIDDVDCPKCTLLRAKEQMTSMLPVAPNNKVQEQTSQTESKTDDKAMQLPSAIRALVFERLQAIQTALDADAFSDKTLSEACKIAKKAHVASTKTRQAVIGRGPQSLVIHLNRSVFDDLAGVQRKNYAAVRYPMILDLRHWTFSTNSEGDEEEKRLDPTSSMLEDLCNGGEDSVYCLKAVITHYGRHENGHYIAYRQHPMSKKPQNLRAGSPDEDAGNAEQEPRRTDSQWWRLSDEDVSPVSEAEMLAQGGVFMLFYERENVAANPARKSREPLQEAKPAVAGPQEPILQGGRVTDSAETSPPGAAAMHLNRAPAVVLPPHSGLPAELGPTLPAPAEPTPVEPVPAESGPAATVPATAEPTSESELTTEDESEADQPAPPRPVQPIPRRRSPPTMRTARTGSAGSGEGFAAAFRPMAAT